jgi:sugar/nucleoside kinase (ribokinase family)
MSAEYDVVVYGTVALDAIWRVDALAPPGGWQPIREERRMIGGEAANTAMALMKWGVRVALIGNALGDDADGSLLRSLFARDAPDLDLRFIRTLPDAHTPYCVCIATPDGHRTMYGTGFDEMQCPDLDPELAQSVPLFTMEPNAWNPGKRAALVAAQHGMKVTAMDYSRDEEINHISHLILTSRDHLGLNLDLPSLEAAAQSLRDRYGKAAVVTCGEQGCFIAEAGKAGDPPTHVPAYVAPAVVDTTGAGDIFRAGLLYGQLAGWELTRAARFAAAAAALNCGAMGGWGGVRSVEQILAFQQTAETHPTWISLDGS